jgi:hypothetical protein
VRGIRLREQEGEITPKERPPQEQTTQKPRATRTSPNAGRRKCCVEGCRRMRAPSRSRCRDCDYELRVERARRDEEEARVRRDTGALQRAIQLPPVSIHAVDSDTLMEHIRQNRNGIMTRLRQALGLEG